MKNLHILLSLCLLLLTAESCAEAMATADDVPFAYRALCTPTNNAPAEFDLLSTNNVDNDWALWGHNLWHVVGKNPPADVCALIDGERNPSQYCFSSDTLFKMITEWIIDQWGESGGRFTIMPADNKKVCQCEHCRALGNTAESATPAVARMLCRLAERFPNHQFFMTAYHTTTQPPSFRMPENAGVFLSTMAIPMRYHFQENKGFKTFDALVDAWHAVTPLMYVWEYGRNFDDYLTPYPCLMILQQRFRYYHQKGITGVFLNGSGHDYSTFDDVQSYVLSRLLLDNSQDVETLVLQFFDTFYPECGRMIADYYLRLEYRLRDNNHIMPYYGTISDTREAYLDADEFVKFWVTLDRRSKTVKGRERQLVNRMLTAMAYTRLMLKPSEDDREEMLLILRDYATVPGLTVYKESGGSLAEFLSKQ